MSEIKVNALTGKTTAKTVTVTVGATATQSLEQGLAKAWFYTTDKTTHVLDNSLNISTITDNDAGRPEANFINNFNNTSIVAAGDGGYNRFIGSYTTDGGITTSSFAHILLSSSGSIGDVASTGVGLGIQYNGDLA
jgi:hypothetical protein